MANIEFTSGLFQFDERFIPSVINAIKAGKTGRLYSPYDSCVIFLNSVIAVEVNGVMVSKADILFL